MALDPRPQATPHDATGLRESVKKIVILYSVRGREYLEILPQRNLVLCLRLPDISLKMRAPLVDRLHLVSLPDDGNYSRVSTAPLDADIRNQHRDRYRSKLTGWSSSWPAGSVNAACPHPVLVTKRHQEQLKDLHLALDLAIEDIIERWWADEEAQFPRRMPLEPEEEELLRVSLITFSLAE